MRIFMADSPFGKIKSVTGINVVIELNDDLVASNLEQEKLKPGGQGTEKLYVGTVGDVFLMGGPDTNDIIHYGIFEEIKLVSVVEEDCNQPASNKDKNKAVVVAKVIGYQDPYTCSNLKFKRGVGIYPRFNSNCFLLSPEEKRILFSIDDDKGVIVGSKSGAERENVAINIDKFLAKHSVILGSTGSGKSCTVASILQKVLRNHQYSHLVFFDLHDEYSSAFQNGNCDQGGFKVNKVDAGSLKMPYWFLNFEELQSICLGDIDYGKNSQGIRILKDEILSLKEIAHKSIEEQVGEIDRININAPLYYSYEDLLNKLVKLNRKTIWKSDGTDAIDEETGDYLANTGAAKTDRKGMEKDQVIQDPNYYNALNQVIEKLESILHDKRFQFLFDSELNSSLKLYKYMSDLLCIPNGGEQNQITILDFSKIPSEVVPVIIGMVARVCFEFKSWESAPKKLPLYLVFEEAHNYIPKEASSNFKLPVKYIGRIAKEGRKYGISQLIISQRPADLCESIISQCSNFFVLRVTNPADQSFVQKVLPDQLNTLTNMIPFFENGECLIAGECVPIPVKCIIDLPNPEPNSNDVPFSSTWKKPVTEYHVEDTIHRWWEIRK